MPATQRRRHQALAQRAAVVPRVGGTRPQAARNAVSAARRRREAHDVTLVERELAELDEECARFRRLHRCLLAARRAGRDIGDILAELGPSVLHLHVHTRGLERLVDTLG